MPTLREIKTHIQSVRNTAKITRAMELVATAKQHRLRARVESTSAFADHSWQVLNHLASAAESRVRDDPMFCGYSDVRRLGLLLITSNRGMVGSYNQYIISLATRYLEAHRSAAEVITIGRVGRNAMLRQNRQIHADFSQLTDHDDITALTPVARVVLDGFHDRVFDEVAIAYTQFHIGARIKPIIRPLLPLCPTPTVERRQYIYEPAPEELLMALLPRLIRFQIYQAFLEALAAENASRMAAMHNATQNAHHLIDELTISYHKTRQQEITSELLDIMGGASALDQDGRGAQHEDQYDYAS